MAVRYKTAAANTKLTEFKETKEAVVSYRKAMKTKPRSFNVKKVFDRSLLSFM